MSVQTIIPIITNERIVIFGMLVFLICRKYIRGTVNNKSNVIPIDKLLEFVVNMDDFVRSIMITIISTGIPKIARLFRRFKALFMCCNLITDSMRN